MIAVTVIAATATIAPAVLVPNFVGATVAAVEEFVFARHRIGACDSAAAHPAEARQEERRYQGFRGLQHVTFPGAAVGRAIG